MNLAVPSFFLQSRQLLNLVSASISPHFYRRSRCTKKKFIAGLLFMTCYLIIDWGKNLAFWVTAGFLNVSLKSCYFVMPCNDADLEREWHKYCNSAHAGLAVAELGSSLHLITNLTSKKQSIAEGADVNSTCCGQPSCSNVCMYKRNKHFKWIFFLHVLKRSSVAEFLQPTRSVCWVFVAEWLRLLMYCQCWALSLLSIKL